MKTWRCSVCGFVHKGAKPPIACPQCGSGPGEFSDKEKEKPTYDGKPFDVLLINGSTHSSHNTAILADIAEQELRQKKVSYRRFDLNKYEIRHCWCCYSMADAECTYPCRDQLDDMPAFHEMIVNSKALIIVSPINWNNMSARLKDFLDRTTCLENLPILGEKSLTTGKVAGILVNGHEDGALKTAMDIFVYLQQLGYILAPFGFTYRTHGAGNDAKTDNKFIKGDKKLGAEVRKVVSNVVETMNMGLETKLKDRIKPVCE
jgi:multimeric flavodoxin WrbA